MSKLPQTLLHYARNLLTSAPSVRRAALSNASRLTVRADIRSLLHALTYALDAAGRKDRAAITDAFVIVRSRQEIVIRIMKTAALTEQRGKYRVLTPAEFVECALAELTQGEYARERVSKITDTMGAMFSMQDAVLVKVLLIDALIRSAANELGIEERAQPTEIRRSISFPPAQKQAAIGVLSYFGEVVASRYPDIDVGVTIEQTRERVTLIVQTPHGTEERMERELENYGRVVSGDLAPEAYLPDSRAAMALRHKLEMAALEVRQTRQLLESARTQFGARIGVLEDDVRFLRQLLSREQHDVHALVAAVRSVESAVQPAARAALSRFIELVERESKVSKTATEQFVEAVRKDRSLLSMLQELLLKGAVQGAAGNYLYNFLQAVITMLR